MKPSKHYQLFKFLLVASTFLDILSGEGQAVRSPRFSPDGQYLIWLQRKAGGPHHGGHQLMCCSWESKKVKNYLYISFTQKFLIDPNIFLKQIVNLC